jgi:hypothetical protein
MKRILGLASAFVLVASFASGQDVGYNFDQQADFTKYKTYKWVAVKGGEQPKGLTKTDSDTADLYVAYQVAVEQEKQMTTWDTGYGMGPGWGGRYYGGYYGGGGMSTSTTSTINIGTVAVDMYDRAGKHLVWRGMASKQLDPKAKPEKRQKNLDKGMQKLFKNYPPKKQ